MIRCIAVDDGPLALEQLKSYIGKTPFLQLTGASPDAYGAMTWLTDGTVDAVFIDINMPGLSGMELIRSLTVRPLVVFTTAYPEYAVEGYKVSAVDYLLKPFGLEDFQRAANKVRKQYDLLHPGRTDILSDTSDILFLKCGYKIVRVNIREIRYIEGMSEYLRIYLDGTPQPLVVLMSIKKLEERLPKDSFVRIHRSYIVNLRQIREIARLRVILDPDIYLPISESYRESFFALINGKGEE